MTNADALHAAPEAAIHTAAEAAGRAIAPLWPLASSVAVNPYLGQAEQSLAEVAARLKRVAGVRSIMPRHWFAARLADGRMTDADLRMALARAAQTSATGPLVPDFDRLMSALTEDAGDAEPLPTIAELAAAASGIDWPAIIEDRIGNWASAWFDEGQAMWAMPRDHGAYAAWRLQATHDLTPEILGLAGFARFVAAAPESAPMALEQASAALGCGGDAAPAYFHRLLVTLGGWAQYGRYQLWQAELGQRSDTGLRDLLAIRLLWEQALFAHYRPLIADGWAAAMARYAAPCAPGMDDAIDAILQEAAEIAGQRDLAAVLATPGSPVAAAPLVQAAFCIDVRSERFRRALEGVDAQVQTIGFAGFFGIGASHRRFASDVAEHRLPVLLNAGMTTRAGGDGEAVADVETRLSARGVRAWGRFKLAAVSSFAFVEAAGPAYVVKLVRDALGLESAAALEPMPRPEPPLDIATRAASAEAVLRAMSLAQDFAPLVLIIGHGAGVTNNPHASALHCGACGGYAGDVNARLLAALLNDAPVRAALVDTGITIPAATLFVAGLHDTTADTVTLFAGDHAADSHAAALAHAGQALAAAGLVARTERALALPHAAGAGSIAHRGKDWAEIRPEWGLAGCNAFIAAPRRRTAGRSLSGRAFLHDYDWQADSGFGVLELILTAPVVVASWISLQYYGSTVAPALFGGGNKLIHNVVGGIGVVEGNGGTLRGGLPWQSVHDGVDFRHDPLRLTVCVEAPQEAISAILARHPGVRALFDNRWLHLFALDAEGRMAWRYAGDLQWESEVAADRVLEIAAA